MIAEYQKSLKSNQKFFPEVTKFPPDKYAEDFRKYYLEMAFTALRNKRNARWSHKLTEIFQVRERRNK